ncbi:low specificity L-threonine aldolase [Frankia sp. CNm7]|uniref:Low specificity L-threonine aldolase n=1 Tax=Frankia nepalensis TaxID=1836974 RepID=A0A937RIB3_9ACTN|nr:GntG family PLP-dependent aldolase [Frankia nepalensis]MBL7498057.1 low specificity L-threonine aldolase [Frankia nepalensis]MBL7516044.1 low specificity L-threonine aldolase [Frankia nepalensis]MBL7520091.1 low specificity L-threonine aldolase [Frankia nepalensis]MBL7629359.1 low specificity L-threonine aldolase [Frankia nepalensis]
MHPHTTSAAPAAAAAPAPAPAAPGGPVDLRSDTVTRPSAGMRRAMADAEVGDDVYGEDPSVRALEEHAADLLGHEAALFVPSGTMGNFCALRASAPAGTEIVADTEAHIVTYELGGLAALGGVQTRTLTGLAGPLDLAEVAAQIRAHSIGHNYNMIRTSALAVENTQARAGGRVWPVERLERLRAITDDAGVVLHCDGARIWNAAVALGVPPRRLGELFGTLSVCLSKGLGAPVGSLVVGDAARVERAHEWRKRLGGGMRQAGVLAAAGLYALRNHLDRLAEDHRRASELAATLADAAPGSLEPKLVETNMILVRVADSGAFVARAAEQGVLVGAVSPTTLRIVTHLDVDDAGIRRAGDILARLLATDQPTA